MKIQRGIVKYKDRNDIVCTYALTDDGKQYYFLDETDTKKFSNGNRIASTALVEAVDPMVKASNVGVIDQNGVVVIPFENKSIRPVNDNVIVIEKAVPTTQSVIDANNLRSDPNAAAQLVSTPATIKDRMNAQMGVQGNYIFNDQFSEATVCDINGTNLVGGENYSFISMANDKLYLAKNVADTPISEFSLTTYELVAAPVTNTIDVAAAQVDPQVVEGALNAAQPADQNVAVAPADPTQVVSTDPVQVADTTGFAPDDLTNVAPPADGLANTEVVMDFDDEAYAAKKALEGEKAEEEKKVSDEVVMDFDDEAYAAKKASAAEEAVEAKADDEVVTVPVDANVAPADVVVDEAMNNTNGTTDVNLGDPVDDNKSEDNITDDLNTFANGVPTDEVVAENTDNFVVNYDDESSEEDDLPPVVEEDDKIGHVREIAPYLEDEEDVEEVKSNGPVTIDAETVLATVDRNNNGIIDSDEIMVPQKNVETKNNDTLLTDIFNEKPATKEEDPFTSFTSTYTDTSYSNNYDSILNDVKPDTMTYGNSYAGDNIMADVAKSMTGLMKQNREQKSKIAQYQGQIEQLESQARLLAEKYKDQSMRFETAANRLQSRNQMLESRVRDQEKIIASQDRELKSLRPQVQGNQDLMRILADAQNMLGTDTYGYDDGSSYYGRRAA